ncbi:MAG: efflux RND transporter periplasmic adaptor subunit [Planctomycetes bacterium]|nr:efflux RND transporter periplasmic adaptor subunit [Planctomycetota bacterium]
MSANTWKFGQMVLGAIPNVIVLSTLIGIGYWGHTQHWRIPKFSELMGAAPLSHGAVADHGTDTGNIVPGVAVDDKPHGAGDPSKAAINTPVTTESADSLPLIHFASQNALIKSGVTTGVVEERHMDEFVTAYGNVTYDESRLAQLSCRVAGIVWRVDKQLGDPVKKGDILAIFDCNEVGRAKAEMLEADVKSDLAVQTLDRLTEAGGAIAVRMLREAEAEVRITRVRRFNAQQALLNLGLPISLRTSTNLTDTELAERLHFLGLPPEVVASLDPETASANLIPLISPFDGMIIDRNIVTGEVVDPNDVQFTIADVNRMWLIVSVRKEDASSLDVGQSVFFSSTGVPGEIETKVSWIAPETDKRTRSVQVRAELVNPAKTDTEGKPGGKLAFRANMYGSARIRVRQHPLALVVPSSAVQWDGTRHLVFSPLSDGVTFRAHPVQLGVIQEGFTEITSGVQRGQPIVATGSYLLKSELLGVEN